MSQNLTAFYSEICEMVDLHIEDNLSVCIKRDNETIPILIDKLPLFLPNDNTIKNMTTIVNGIPTKRYELFNPCSESAVKDSNLSLVKLKNILDLKFLGVFFNVGRILLEQMFNEESSKDNMTIIKFTSLLTRHKTTSKKIIDKKTINTWVKLYDEITTNYLNKKYVKLSIVRGGKVDDVVCTRTGSLTFPLGEELFEDDAQMEILDVKLRTKDKHIFKSLYELIVGSKENVVDGFSLGTTNKIAPGTHVLLMMYDKMFKMLKPVIDSLYGDLTENDKKTLSIKPLPFNLSVLSEQINNFEQEIKRVPTDAQVIKSKPETVNPFDNITPENINNSDNTLVTDANSKKGFWDKFTNNSQQQGNVNPNMFNQQQQNPLAMNNMSQMQGQGNVNPNMLNQQQQNPLAMNNMSQMQGQGNVNPTNPLYRDTNFNNNLQNVNNNSNIGNRKPILLNSSKPKVNLSNMGMNNVPF